MEQQPEFGFVKELELKPAKPLEEAESVPKTLDEKTGELPLEQENLDSSTHCQYCEDTDPNCRYCRGRYYSEK